MSGEMKVAGKETERSLGSRLIESLEDTLAILKSGDPIEKHLKVRTVRSRIEVSKYGPEEIRKVREELRASQGVFAEFLGVTPLTVSAWELGRRKASKTICRYLDDIQEFPELWSRRMERTGTK
jgi:putative transcriptional regulator